MFVICVSLNYQKLPIDIRQQVVFDKSDLTKANQLLNDEKSILENVILSTCNRTEIYAVVDQIHTGKYYVKRFLANWFHLSVDQITEWSVIEIKEAAVTHLVRLATGLESLIVGEPQILGQLKTAFFAARDADTTGAIFNHLFNQAIAFAKRMHTQYPVSELAKTSGQTGLHQIKVHLTDLKDKELLIVGMGDIGTHVVKNASTMGFKQIYVLNRTFTKAQQVAAEYENLKARPIEELVELVNHVDAVILATATKVPLINQKTFNHPDDLPILIDLGVPRNVDISGISADNKYYDIDHLTEIIANNNATKSVMINEIASLIPQEVANFFAWQRQLHLVPVIRQLRESTLATEKQVYDSLLRKLPELDSHQRKVISKHMKSIVNQMIKRPIKEIKELSVQDDAKADLEFFCRLFGLQFDDK